MQKKISEKNCTKAEYSRLVCERFCTLFREGKIYLTEQMKIIEMLSNDMKPQTISEYRNPDLNCYNSVKNAIDKDRLMSFKIGSITFIPKCLTK